MAVAAQGSVKEFLLAISSIFLNWVFIMKIHLWPYQVCIIYAYDYAYISHLPVNISSEGFQNSLQCFMYTSDLMHDFPIFCRGDVCFEIEQLWPDSISGKIIPANPLKSDWLFWISDVRKSRSDHRIQTAYPINVRESHWTCRTSRIGWFLQ